MIPSLAPNAPEPDAPELSALEPRSIEIGAAPDGAGFYLLDDAGGRFVIDRVFGVVSLADEALLQREAGAIHEVRLKVVEASGASYELAMKLRLTGAVPQMVGAEEFAAIAALASVAACEPMAPAEAQREPTPVAWTDFAAALAAPVKAPLKQHKGALIQRPMPVLADAHAGAALALANDAPYALPVEAAWSL